MVQQLCHDNLGEREREENQDLTTKGVSFKTGMSKMDRLLTRGLVAKVEERIIHARLSEYRTVPLLMLIDVHVHLH